jgi:MATE family multidrug resistance protein
MFKNIYKVLSFAFPISTGALLNMLSSFIAMLMVAKLGKLELAAGALAVSTFIVMMTVVATIFYALGILISHHKGNENAEMAISALVRNGFWLAIILAIPTALCLANADKLLLFFGQDLQLVLITQDYFFYAGLSMFPILIGGVITQFYSGIGNPKFTLLFSLISLPIMILLSYGFVLGNFGLPSLGLGGVACSSFITQSLLCLGVIAYMCASQKIRAYSIFTGKGRFWPNWSLCKSILVLGLPIGIQFGGEIAAMAGLTYLMGFFGVIALAATQIVSQYSMLFVMVTLGLSQALSILISQAKNKQDYSLIKGYIISAILILVLFLIITYTLFFLNPEALVNLYINDINNVDNIENNELTNLTITLFSISAIIVLFDGIRNLLSGGLRGLRDSKAPMIVGIVCLWGISLPMAYVTAFTFEGGPVGLRTGFISGFVIAAVLLWLRIQKHITPMRVESGHLTKFSSESLQ